MRLLLDTHTFVWWDIEPGRLSTHALSLCRDPDNQLVLSTVSVWEIQIKAQLGKLRLEKSLADMVTEQQQTNHIEVLPVLLGHVLAIESLPRYHKEPFDRMLVAQARVEAIPLISRDRQLSNYSITVEW